MLQRHYPTWAIFVISIASGLLRMIGVRGINLRGLVHFLYLAKGDDFLREHDGKTYIYNNGAFTIFTGLSPESLLSRCHIYADCVDGAMWGICKRGGLHGRSDLETVNALAGSLAAISRADVTEIDDVEGSKGKCEPDNDRLRFRHRAPDAEDDIEGGEMEISPNISDDVAHRAFLHLTFDLWKERLANPSRLENAPTNTFATNIALR